MGGYEVGASRLKHAEHHRHQQEAVYARVVPILEVSVDRTTWRSESPPCDTSGLAGAQTGRARGGCPENGHLPCPMPETRGKRNDRCRFLRTTVGHPGAHRAARVLHSPPWVGPSGSTLGTGRTLVCSPSP